MRSFRFGSASVVVDPGERMVVTRWDDGVVLAARPVYDDESRARARELGYGDDDDAVWRMTSHHDLLHHVVAVAFGEPFSEHLRRVASGQLSPDGHREEAVVLLLQRALNVGLAGLVA